jgi:hypothetical protein
MSEKDAISNELRRNYRSNREYMLFKARGTASQMASAAIEFE